MNISSTPSLLLILFLLCFILLWYLLGLLSVSLRIYGNRCLKFSYPPRFEFPKKTTTKTMSTPSDVQGGERDNKRLLVIDAKLSAIEAIQLADIEGEALNKKQTAFKAWVEDKKGGLDAYQTQLDKEREKLYELLKASEV